MCQSAWQLKEEIRYASEELRITVKEIPTQKIRRAFTLITYFEFRER